MPLAPPLLRRLPWRQAGVPAVPVPAAAAAVTPFPAGLLDIRVEAQLGSLGWTDISHYALQRDMIQAGRGHPDESTQTPPSTLALSLKNPDGRFTSKNPTGPYYGLLGRNTPLRVSVPEGASYLRLEGADQASGASCPAANPLNVTGDLDVQIDVTLDNWGANQALCGMWAAAGNQRSWLLRLDEAGTLTLLWSTGGNAASSAVSTQPVPVPGLRRQALRATLAVASGTVTFYTAPPTLNQATAGPITAGWAQLGTPVVSGATSIFASTAVLSAGYVPGATDLASYTGIYGKVHRLGVLSGIGGTAVASPDFTVQAAKASSFADAQGNVWAVQGTAELSNRRYRCHVEMAAWPQEWDPTGADVWTACSGGGVLRRISRSGKPARSAMKRAVLNRAGSLAPVAAWPCEDAPGATQFASAIGGFAMALGAGSVLAADSSSFACSAPLPQIQSSTWTGLVPASADTGTIVVRFLLNPLVVTAASYYLMEIDTTGSAGYAVEFVNGSGYRLMTAVTQVALTGFVAITGPAMVSVELTSSGGNITPNLSVMTTAGAITTAVSGGPVAGVTGRVQQVVVNGPSPGANGSPQALGATVVGHVFIQTALESLSNFASPLAAWAGETAGNRFARLCSENGIAFRGNGNLDASAAMGTQTQQTLMALLQECEDTERGMITEPRQVLGLGFRTLASLQNQQPAVILSYTQAHLSPPLTPLEDDQPVLNDLTFTRSGGSSSEQVQVTGALSVNAPPGGVGTYDAQATINPQADSQVDSITAWALHAGTVNEPRYPQINLDLSRPELAGLYHDLQEIDMGDRVVVTATPGWLPPDGLSQIAQGSNEALWQRQYVIGLNGVPESPYQVVQLDPGPILSENDAHFAASTGTWTAPFGGFLAQTSSPPVAAPTGNAMSVTAAFNASVLVQTGLYPAIPGHQYLFPAWFLATAGTAGQGCSAGVSWFDANGVFLSGPAVPAVADNVTAWTPAFVIAAAPAGAYQMAATVLMATTTAGQVHYVSCITPYDLTWSPPGHLDTDGSVLDRSCGTADASIWVNPVASANPLWTTLAADFPFDIIIDGERLTVSGITGTTAPQQFSVIRSVNGVVRGHAAGADVRLFTPPVMSI